MYSIVRVSDGREWLTESPCFVRMDNGTTSITNEKNAHGVWVDGVTYHILGRGDIPGSEDVLLGVCEETTEGNG